MTNKESKNQLFLHFKRPSGKKGEAEVSANNPLLMHFKNPLRKEVAPKIESEQQSLADSQKQESKETDSD